MAVVHSEQRQQMALQADLASALQQACQQGATSGCRGQACQSSPASSAVWQAGSQQEQVSYAGQAW